MVRAIWMSHYPRYVCVVALLCCARAGRTQQTHRWRLLLGDCVVHSTSAGWVADDALRERVTIELKRSLRTSKLASVQYSVVSDREVGKLSGPSNGSGALTQSIDLEERVDVWRPCIDSVGADALIEVVAQEYPGRSGRRNVLVNMRFVDAMTSCCVISYSEHLAAHGLASAIRRLVPAVTRECLARNPIEGTIASRDGDSVVLRIGKSSGVHVGDRFAVLSEVKGKIRRVGYVRAKTVTDYDTAAVVIADDYGKVGAGAQCRYIPEYIAD